MTKVFIIAFVFLMTMFSGCNSNDTSKAVVNSNAVCEELIRESDSLVNANLDSLDSFAAKIYVMKSENIDIPHIIEENIEQARAMLYSKVDLDSICEDTTECCHIHNDNSL